MANQVILLDSSVLIEYYRKKDKTKTVLYKISPPDAVYAISVITHYEIYMGANPEQISYWDDFFLRLFIIPVDLKISQVAVEIATTLKKSRKLIEFPDILIAATAIAYDHPCATLNKKHFDRIKDLDLVEY